MSDQWPQLEITHLYGSLVIRTRCSVILKYDSFSYFSSCSGCVLELTVELLFHPDETKELPAIETPCLDFSFSLSSPSPHASFALLFSLKPHLFSFIFSLRVTASPLPFQSSVTCSGVWAEILAPLARCLVFGWKACLVKWPFQRQHGTSLLLNMLQLPNTFTPRLCPV